METRGDISSLVPHNGGAVMNFVKHLWISAFTFEQRNSIGEEGEEKSITYDSGPFSSEVVLYLFGFMGAKEVTSCSRVCKMWNVISQDYTIWKRLCIQDSFVSITSSSSIPAWATSWHSLYKFYYECKFNIFSVGQVKNGRGSFTWPNGATVTYFMILPYVISTKENGKRIKRKEEGSNIG
jgi:hypothetical protein